MTCPACGGALTPVDVPGLTVDVCRDGCAGIWFDRSELRSVDEPAENAGEALVGLAGTPRVIVDATGRRRCPRCPDSVLMRHFYSAKRAVAVDECPTCAGTWLDGGELAEIRAEYASGGDRRQAVQLLAEEILANDRMALMRKQLDEELPFYDASRSRIVASLLVVVYVGAAFMVAGSAAALRVFAWSVFPWMCGEHSTSSERRGQSGPGQIAASAHLAHLVSGVGGDAPAVHPARHRMGGNACLAVKGRVAAGANAFAAWAYCFPLEMP